MEIFGGKRSFRYSNFLSKEKIIGRQRTWQKEKLFETCGEREWGCNRRMKRILEMKNKKNRLNQEAKTENTFLIARKQEGENCNLLFPSSRRESKQWER